MISELGKKIILSMAGHLNPGEWDYSYYDVNELSKELNISTEKIRGALGHLYKNGYLYSYEWDKNDETIHLTKKGWKIAGYEC